MACGVRSVGSSKRQSTVVSAPSLVTEPRTAKSALTLSASSRAAFSSKRLTPCLSMRSRPSATPATEAPFSSREAAKESVTLLLRAVISPSACISKGSTSTLRDSAKEAPGSKAIARKSRQIRRSRKNIPFRKILPGKARPVSILFLFLYYIAVNHAQAPGEPSGKPFVVRHDYHRHPPGPVLLQQDIDILFSGPA